MTATIEKMTTIEDSAAVKTARAAWQPVAQRQDALAKQLQRHLRVSDPFSKLHEEERITEEDRLVAEADASSVRIALAKTTLEARRLEAAVDTAREAERARLEAIAQAELKKAVAALIAALAPARAANEA